MRRFTYRVLTACLSAALTIASFVPSVLATELENDSAVAGIAVNLNNYYAASYTPEKDILDYLMPQMNSGTQAPSTEAQTAGTTAAQTVAPETTAQSVAYQSAEIAADLIADGAAAINTGMVSVLNELYVRKAPSTSAEKLGALSSNCKVDIYNSVSNEEGDWYLVAANGLEGYISAAYVRTGSAAEVVEANVSNKVATVIADTVEAKRAATETAEAVDTLYKGERYDVVEAQGDYVKLSNGEYVIGYVPLAGVKVETELPEALAAEDAETVALLKDMYMKDIDYTKTIYTQRMVDGDYTGALAAITYVVELWGYYINEANYAGMTDLAVAAQAEQAAAIALMEEVRPKAETQAPVQTPVESVPETSPAVPEAAPAPVVPEATAPTTSGNLSIVMPTQAPVVIGIEACYRGGTKYAGDVIYSAELFVRATMSDGSVQTIENGWYSEDVGMILHEGNKVVTMYYDNYSSVFELPIHPAPTTAPPPTQAPAPTQPQTQAPTLNPSRDYRSEIVGYALSWVGRCNYVWAGANLVPGGQVDCSGFTMCVFRNVAGISLPHYSYAQLNCGSGISYEQLRPGDLVFYERHVAIYIGGGQIVHAKSPQAGIVVDSVYFSATQPPIGFRSILP